MHPVSVGIAGENPEILRLALPIFNLPRDDPRWCWMLWHPLFRSLECFKLVLQHCNPDASLYFGRTILHDIVGVYGRGPNRERQFANLSIQEGRLRRQAEKDPAELNAFQQPRIQATEARLNEAADLYIGTVRANRQEEFDPEALGFEFTLEQIEVRAIELQPDLFDDYWDAEKDCDRNDVAASPTA